MTSAADSTPRIYVGCLGGCCHDAGLAVVAENLSFATKSPTLIFQGKTCRKSRVRKSALRD